MKLYDLDTFLAKMHKALKLYSWIWKIKDQLRQLLLKSIWRALRFWVKPCEYLKNVTVLKWIGNDVYRNCRFPKFEDSTVYVRWWYSTVPLQSAVPVCLVSVAWRPPGPYLGRLQWSRSGPRSSPVTMKCQLITTFL